MTVTYTHPFPDLPKVKVPALHRVVYDNIEYGTTKVWELSYRQLEVNRWLEANCKGRYYHGPGWREEQFIEFEDDQDAMWFALKYGQ
jgi:hypothetical protein